MKKIRVANAISGEVAGDPQKSYPLYIEPVKEHPGHRKVTYKNMLIIVLPSGLISAALS